MKASHASKALLAIAIVSAMFASQTVAGDHKSNKKDIVETAVAAGSFNTLATALTKAGLVETLKSDGPFTVFAPTDEAFAKIPKSTLTALLNDKEQLTKVLLYHVVSGEVMSSDVAKIKSAKTVEGSKVSISVEDGTVMVDKAKVVKVDIEASNGIIHVIDSVLLPPAKVEKKANMY
ncbi:MAG: fasciclin domain-containing protein [Bacteroidota bacterium]